MEKFECSACGDAFETAGELAEHVKEEHTSEDTPDTFECKLCEAQFETEHQLEAHIDRTHGEASERPSPAEQIPEDFSEEALERI